MAENNPQGHIHPLTRAIRDIHAIFGSMGFEIADGPLVETEFYNFDALNVAADHPARDMQDTFWVKPETVNWEIAKPVEGRSTKPILRTHTSPVQVRYMETHKPPFRIIVPGLVFRNEATDATHEAQFYQLEGLVIDKKVSLAELKGTLETFYKKYLGSDIEIRFRPSYFPFVEPAVEVDIKWNGKWLEVLGAGLVHPHVLRSAGLNPDEWQGFAFGGGIERAAMLKYGIPDVRDFYSGDLRFITQF